MASANRRRVIFVFHLLIGSGYWITRVASIRNNLIIQRRKMSSEHTGCCNVFQPRFVVMSFVAEALGRSCHAVISQNVLLCQYAVDWILFNSLSAALSDVKRAPWAAYFLRNSVS